MKVVLDIPDVLLDEIDDSISIMTNSHCQYGSGVNEPRPNFTACYNVRI